MVSAITYKPSLFFISFLQALGLFLYCLLIGLFMWKANTIFGPVYSFIGPALFLILFVVSAVISALIYLGYPFILLWEKKQPRLAIKLVIYTTLWAAFFFLLFLFLLWLFFLK